MARLGNPRLGSGQQLWDWMINSNPIVGLMVSDLTADQQAAVRRTLDGMLRDRCDGESRAALTARLDIGVGTK